jgi:ketosteroid isomerase-like protein
MPAGSGDTVTELERLAQLHTSGALSDEEFSAASRSCSRHERHAEPTGHAMSSNAERAAMLIRGLAASVTGDSSVVADLYADDVQGWSPAMRVSSAAELAIEFEDREEAFSDVELGFAPLDVSGDRACVEWTMTATHSGPLVVDDDLNLDATGLRITLHGVTVAEFADGRIRSFRQYWDEGELLALVGLLPDE